MAESHVISDFRQDITKYQWVSLDNVLIQQAQILLMKYGSEGLRTLDAIQLASALTLKNLSKSYFFTADKLLQTFFNQEGLLVIYETL